MNTLVAKLQDMNARVAKAEVEWGNARIARTKSFYAKDSSILTTVRGVKNYVRAIHGVRSEQYKQLKALRFIQPPN